MLSQLLPPDQWELSRWSWAQLQSITEELLRKIDYHQERCLRYHYSSGRYIDSSVKLRCELLPALDKIQHYVRTSVPAGLAADMFPRLVADPVIVNNC